MRGSSFLGIPSTQLLGKFGFENEISYYLALLTTSGHFHFLMRSMESTGHRGRIQISQSTADNLILVGKDRWIRAREDKVEAKGKGTMQTYWLEMDTPRGVSDDMKDLADRDKQLIVVEDTAPTDIPDRPIGITRNQARLVGWMSEVLQDYVKQIVS